jgi:hypothetical protein
MYLDDGLGGADTFEKCKDVSLVVKNDLFNFGFYLVLSLTDLPNTACVKISCPITEASNPTGITLVVCRLLQMYIKQEKVHILVS